VIDENLVWLGVLINFVGGAWYATITLRAHTRPNPVSWVLWSVTGWIAVGGQLAEGAGLEVLLTVTVAAIPTMIAAATLVARLTRSRGTFEPITKLDLVCAGLSVGTLVVWWLTASGVVAIALSIAVDALPALPILRQAIRSPKSDHPSIWVGGTISATITLLTVKEHGFVTSGFAIYFLVLCASMTFLLLAWPALRGRAARPPATTSGVPAGATAFAGAFAADYLSWDESDPGRRGEALVGYFDGVRPEMLVRLGWSGGGRQRVEFVLPGEATPGVRAGTVTVDIRVRFTPYVRCGPGTPRRTLDPAVLRAEHATTGHPAAAPAAAAIGWTALSSRWTRLLVTVDGGSGQLQIVAGPIEIARPLEDDVTRPVADLPALAAAAAATVRPQPHPVAPARRRAGGGPRSMTAVPAFAGPNPHLPAGRR
jgi:hypothetical protein